MRKSVGIVLIALILSGCQGEIPEKLDKRVLYDSDGCAFVVRSKDLGESVFLTPLKEVSKETCKITFGE